MKPAQAALVLARMDSQRFPGKALTMLAGKHLIQWCTDALMAQNQFEVILATSDRPVDDPLAAWARTRKVPVFRGSSNDVAQRILDCGREFSLDYFARINGDSPFVNVDLIRQAFQLASKHQYDIVTNLVPRAFPYGVSVEVLNFQTFDKVFNDPGISPHREHITSYFYKNLQLFNYYCIPYDHESHHDVRLTVDQPEDLEKMEKLLKQIPGPQPHSLGSIVKAYRKLFRDQ